MEGSRRTARRQPDPYILLAAAGAVTERAKLGTIVANAGLQHPRCCCGTFLNWLVSSVVSASTRPRGGLEPRGVEALGLVWQSTANGCSAWRRRWCSDASSSTTATGIFMVPKSSRRPAALTGSWGPARLMLVWQWPGAEDGRPLRRPRRPQLAHQGRQGQCHRGGAVTVVEDNRKRLAARWPLGGERERPGGAASEAGRPTRPSA